MAAPRWFAVSVVTNGLLAAALIASLRSSDGGAQRIPEKPRIARASPFASLAGRAIGSKGVAAPSWTKWVGAVRSTGVAGNALAALIAADFDRRWEVYQRDLQARLERGDIDTKTMTRALAQHDRALENELRDALGDIEFRAWKKGNLLRDFAAAHVSLTAVESDRIFDARVSLERQRRDLEDAHDRGEIDSPALADREAALAAECQAQVGAIVGEARLTEMNAVRDGVDADLRQTLGQFGLSAQEMNSLADLQRAKVSMQTELESRYGSDPSYAARRSAIDAARDAAYESILGPTRFEAWQQATDPRYRVMAEYGAALHLDAGDIASVYATVQAQEKQARAYQLQALSALEQGNRVDWAAVQTQIEASKRTTELSLRRSLGDERFEQLQRNGVMADRY